MKYILLLLFLFGNQILFAQLHQNTHFIQFTDKNNSNFNIENPEAFLSPRAIARRNHFNIPIQTNDLPVNKWYVDSLVQLGAKIQHVSKWFNGATIYDVDSVALVKIMALPFVKKSNIVTRPDGKIIPVIDKFEKTNPLPFIQKTQQQELPQNYGLSLNQIEMLKGNSLHSQGYQGQNMLIAVLDAGFVGTNLSPAFQALYDENRIVATFNAVDKAEEVYVSSGHGTSVLSCMAGVLPGQLIGTAPEANYILLRTEYTPSELLIEEYNWLVAAEFADSLGADVFNTSLGYRSGFSNPDMDHAFDELDGDQTPITIASDIAASKGILVINSAGNNGTNGINAPADADSILAIGAVSANGTLAGFSSIGPTFDGRIKPDVVAQGAASVVLGGAGGVRTSNGTSFSSPILAGVAACLWQAFPDANNMEIIEAIKMSGHQANNPDILMGYGIPDFERAFEILAQTYTPSSPHPKASKEQLLVYPNPSNQHICFDFYLPENQTVEIKINNNLGQLIYLENKDLQGNKNHSFRIDEFQNWQAGVYILSVNGKNIDLNERIVKY